MQNDLTDIREALTEIKVTLAENTTQLTYHIARTDLLEAQVKSLDKDVTKLHGFFSIGGWVAAICATLITIWSQIRG